MLSDLLQLVPDNLRQQALDALVDVLSGQAQKFAGDEVAGKIKKLRSDAAFQHAFEQGMARALRRFVEAYQEIDEDLVAAVAQDKGFFHNKEVQAALLAVLKRPGAYLDEEREVIDHSFTTVLPGRINRERVDKAVVYLLKCLAEELWHLPQLAPVYSLQFQRITAESAREQVAIQKAQLQALASLGAGVREALLQLTGAIAEQKLLPAGDGPALPPSPKVYHNLPQPDYGEFVGREQEFQQVLNILRPYPHSQYPLVTVDGIGGIGKSALALEVAYHYLQNAGSLAAEERFDAIIWTSAKQNVLTAEGIKPRYQALRTLDDIYATIAATLQREDINRAAPKEQTQVVGNALAQQRTLLIVDNLESIDDEAVLAFLRELPAPTKAIVTTRHRLDVAYPVRLRGMSWEEANQLIEHEAHKKNVRLSESQRRRLYERAGGVPLAIVWSIGQMGFGYKVSAVLNRLNQPSNDMIRFCFEESLRRVKTRPAYKLLMALSLFVPDGRREALGFVAGLPELDRDDGLVDLEKLSLVNKDGDRFSFLPVTQTFASAELNRDREQARAYGRRWLDYFKQLYEQYYGSGNEYRLRYGNFAFLDDGPNMLEAIAWAYENGTTDDIFVLTVAVSNYLDATGRWNTLLSLINRGLELARTSADVRALGRLGDLKAWLLEQRGELDEAESTIHESLACYRQLKDEEAETVLLQRLSAIYRKRGDFTKARSFIESAYAIAERLQNGDLMALVDTQHGKLARDQQDWEKAGTYLARYSADSNSARNRRPRTKSWPPVPGATWHLLPITWAGRKKPEICVCAAWNFSNAPAPKATWPPLNTAWPWSRQPWATVKKR